MWLFPSLSCRAWKAVNRATDQSGMQADTGSTELLAWE